MCSAIKDFLLCKKFGFDVALALDLPKSRSSCIESKKKICSLVYYRITKGGKLFWFERKRLERTRGAKRQWQKGRPTFFSLSFFFQSLVRTEKNQETESLNGREMEGKR